MTHRGSADQPPKDHTHPRGQNKPLAVGANVGAADLELLYYRVDCQSWAKLVKKNRAWAKEGKGGRV